MKRRAYLRPPLAQISQYPIRYDMGKHSNKLFLPPWLRKSLRFFRRCTQHRPVVEAPVVLSMDLNTPLSPELSRRPFPEPGAAEVCLTDGDDASLRLAESNIAANIPWMQDLGRESAASGFVSTRRLRWGCAGDIEALLASSGNSLSSSSPCDGGDSPWEVIVGSDIAAFPYASAYDDLLQTIAALAKSIRKFQSATSGSDGKGLGEEHRHSCSNAANSQPSGSNNEKHRSHCSATCKEGKRSKRTAPAATSEHKLNANASSRRGQRLTEEGEATGAGKVVVLLAHKQRHDSEEAFFRAAKESLGASVDLGEEDVHPDFRDSGIRLHMFVVD